MVGAELRDELKRLIVESLRLDAVAPLSIEDDAPLFGGGLGLDSVDALELVVAIERRFGLVMQGDDLDKEVFATVSTLAAFLERRMAAAGADGGRG